MAIKRVFLMILLSLAMIASVSANSITCDIDNTPIIPSLDHDSRVPLVCTTETYVPSDYSCYSQVMGYYDTDLSSYVPRLFQLNPVYVDDINVVDILADGKYATFNLKTGESYLNAYITGENLQINTNYTVGILCSGGGLDILTWNDTIIPQYKGLSFLGDRAVWANQNSNYLVFGFFILVIICVILAYLIKTLRDR